MRIVAGEFRGRTIEAPDGVGTRPTTDRVREALFSSLFSLRGGFEGSVVLDAFAGSGALGLEALSRGARTAVFYESSRKAADALRKNVSGLGIGQDRASIVTRDVFESLSIPAAGPFDLVFLDPPYAYDPVGVLKLIADGIARMAVSEEAIIAYEHAVKDGGALLSASDDARFRTLSVKKYGKTAVALLTPER